MPRELVLALLGLTQAHALSCGCPRLATRAAVVSRAAPPQLLQLFSTEERTNKGTKAAGKGVVRPTGRAMRTPPKKAEDTSEGGEGLAAAGALASSAVIAEGIQLAGTAVLFAYGQQLTGTSNPVEAVSAMIEYLQALPGFEGYALFGGLMIFLQVVPIAAAFVLTLSAGAIFGIPEGVATVLTCSTISATISFAIARAVGRERLQEYFGESKQFNAIDAAFGDVPFQKSLTLITLLRLSPVLPFAWANYVFGLSPVPLPAFSIGTFVGCLPAVTAYVSAGAAGASVAVNGAESNPIVVALGVAATLGAISIGGNIATDAVKEQGLDLSE